MDATIIIQQLINGLSRGAVYALIAVGFALIFSVLKFSNFAHGGLISISAYTGYFFSSILRWHPAISIICCALVGAVLGVILDTMGFRMLRRRNSPNIFYFVSSITCGILFMNILTIFFGTTFYAVPPFFDMPVIEIAEVFIVKMDVLMLAVCLVLLVLMMLIINRTRLGLALRAVALDGDTSMLMGINTNVVIIATFMLAGGLAGVSGIFLGANFTIDPFLGNMVVKGFVASVIGGLGSLSGAIMGALLLGTSEVLLTMMVGDIITPAVVFVITLAFLLIRPQGISGRFTQDKA